MNRKGIAVEVLYNGIPAGILTKMGSHYTFRYDPSYLANLKNRPISVTLPLSEQFYESDILFPVFVNMLSEGANKRIQSRMLKIDENDYFGLLMATAADDSIGPLTIRKTNGTT
ncbi:MAG: HipA N-terminal domain-containing protein [Chitinophagaceae bacterium]|nr:HipA N-terminal domain-containing protein [Chitinophagaceae bacterium]